MKVSKGRAWPAFAVGIVLAVVGLLFIGGAAGSIVLALGLVAIFGGAVRLISRNDPRPPDERRVPAGHSGV
jgi:hypothetical protein